MIYTQEFKVKCFNTLRYSNIDVSKLLAAMDAKNDTQVRYYLEDALDDELLYENSLLSDEGDRLVANSKINAHKQRLEIYSEFMESYISELDKVEVFA